MMPTANHNQILQKSRPKISVLDFDRTALLEMIRQKLGGRNVAAGYFFGSFACGKEHLWSDIDLIIVKDSKLPFIERPREFFDLMDIGIPVDILVYTPDEFENIKKERKGFWQEIQSKIIQIV
jgi:predicted nucleotidyltransferase